ncbi:SDR family oxidoreductase [Moorella naiadis]|uniref:SDR family NAD(P)-dependent oxidoreductase n=1 Tax=Moorella naiadis (nom. illeg.) TaxID=3093670 RepID=UPI003D9C947D
MLLLKGKTALVTGASRGIGRAIVLALAKNGVNLALNSRSMDNLKDVAQEAASHGVDVLLCPADLAEAATPAQIIKRVVKYFGGLDILINNAGVAIQKPLADTSIDEWDLLLAVNARAPFLLCREAIPYLQKSEAATIINIASVVGTKGYINQGAYTAAKHALMGMTKVLAQELYEADIRVHVISPGGVATDMVAKMRPDLEAASLIAPEEIAAIVLFLLTHRGNAVIDEINVRRASNRPWR